LERFDGSAGSRTRQIGIYQYETQRHVPRPTSHNGQATDHTLIQRASYQVHRQPGVSQASLNGRERCLHAAYGAAKFRPQPPIVPRLLDARIAYDHLYMAHEVLRCEYVIGTKEGVARSRYRDERYIQEPLPEITWWHASRDHDIRSAIYDRILCT